MTAQITRRLFRAAAAIALCGIAAIAATGCAAATSATAAGQPRPVAVTTADVPVLVDCATHAQIRPGRYILACADGKLYHLPATTTYPLSAYGGA